MSQKVKRGDLLSSNELSTFCAQMSMILKSGITVGEGVSIMSEDVKNPQGKQLLDAIHAQLEIGEPMYKALESTGKFPKYVVDMTEIGESTGKLDDVMDSLCLYYEREENISRTVRNAVTYPLIMIVMMLVVIVVLIVKVMPIFNQVFEQLGSEMNDFSKSVLNLGVYIGRYAYVIVGIIAVLAAAFLIFRKTETGKKTLAHWRATFFITRKLSRKIASGRFASAMAMMLSSGLDTDQSLDMVYRLVDNVYIREKIKLCRSLIDEGVNFSDALVKAELFSGVYARMVSIGFKTGAVDTVMNKLAGQYEEEIDNQIGTVISVLEPTLVAVLSIIVGMILLSVMLPLMGIMSSIG